ncbi:S-adenosyl-L-methionine-dependent methyltransferase, partial [Lineolata rhizophorae]
MGKPQPAAPPRWLVHLRFRTESRDFAPLTLHSESSRSKENNSGIQLTVLIGQVNTSSPNTMPARSDGNKQRQDERIINTNSFSILSKRSVHRLYFPDQPDHYALFTTKFERRAPLINRGYWLRMHAVRAGVLRFLGLHHGASLSSSPSQPVRVVVNLGCGYDLLPFQLLRERPELCENIVFVDVDYPQLIQAKADIISRTAELSGLLINVDTSGSDKATPLRSQQYVALGCDLRNLSLLESFLTAGLGRPACAFLFYAEVSLTYMPVADADAVIRLASSFHNSHFLLLEQQIPSSTHPFTITMLDHFATMGTPLHAPLTYPSLASQLNRFARLGWRGPVRARSLWNYWLDRHAVGADEVRYVESREAFDEWEELGLFAGAYFVLCARNGGGGEGEGQEKAEEWVDLGGTELETGENESQDDVRTGPGLRFDFHPHSTTGDGETNASFSVRRRFAAILLSPSPSPPPDAHTLQAFAHHAGLGPRNTRVTTSTIYTPLPGPTTTTTAPSFSRPSPPQPLPPPFSNPPLARGITHHTITPIPYNPSSSSVSSPAA